MADSAPLNLTLGIEIETIIFVTRERLLAYCEPEELDKSFLRLEQETHDRVVNGIWALLYRANIPFHIRTMELWQFPGQPRRPEPAYENWSIEWDESIKETFYKPSEGGSMGFELVSRVLTPTSESMQEVSQVLDLIKSRFSMSNNASTGLHIHIGNGGKEFPLGALKNFAMLVVAFEDLIHSLHPPERLQSRYCKPPSLCVDFEEDSSLFSKVLRIEACESVADLVSLMNPRNRRCAYNFYNLLPRADSRGKITIEFRQHAGSSDAVVITNWASFAASLVKYCHEAPEGEHRLFCVEKSRDSSYTIFDLMETIGRGDLIPFYQSRIFDHDNGGSDDGDSEIGTEGEEELGPAKSP